MRFKSQQKSSPIPEINLVPMMDVIMTILTFFIIVSMTLRPGQKTLEVNLPQGSSETQEETTIQPLIVELNTQGQVSAAGQLVENQNLPALLQTYLEANPQGSVLLKADQSLPYSEVVKVLGQMRQVGGDRVSLAIE
jgi:biopolymer transport protein ExbD